jgi:hypothetical protein
MSLDRPAGNKLRPLRAIKKSLQTLQRQLAKGAPSQRKQLDALLGAGNHLSATLEWPAYGWVVAALILVALMTIQGLGFLTPVNVFVCVELQKIEPDMKKISYWMQRYLYSVALQGTMQAGLSS